MTLCSLLLTQVGLRLLGLKRTARIGAGRGRRRRAATSASIEDIVAAVNRVADLVPVRSDCLRRAVVAQQELCRQGVDVDVVVGVRLVGRQLAAHAWVERMGRPLGVDSSLPAGYWKIALVTPSGELRNLGAGRPPAAL
jgi:hypothetical protein